MKFSSDFKRRVKSAITLLNEANKSIANHDDDMVGRVCAYNSTVLGLKMDFGGEWWVFRNKNFRDGYRDDGFITNNVARDPFRSDVPRRLKKNGHRVLRVDPSKR